MELETTTDILVNELLGAMHSFNVSYSVQTGIGMLPILFYGTKAQKEKYLAPIIAGEIKPAYALTEPTSGSDALSAKATAVLDESGENYILNGRKCGYPIVVLLISLSFLPKWTVKNSPLL